MKPMEVTASRSHGESEGLMEFQSEIDVVVAERAAPFCDALLPAAAVRAASCRTAFFFLSAADTMALLEVLKKCWKGLDACQLLEEKFRLICRSGCQD